MAIKDIKRSHVLAAIAAYDKIGEDFPRQHGFGFAKTYILNFPEGDLKRYASKAVLGFAHSFIPGMMGLNSTDFSGGEKVAARALRELGFDVEGPGRNPDWSRDELILALHLYLAHRSSPPGKRHPKTTELSALLSKMHRLLGSVGTPTLRNPEGVYLKMMNFRAIDPQYVNQGKVGMKGGGALDRAVWNEFSGRADALALEADAIETAVRAAKANIVAGLPEPGDYEGDEGGVILALHKRYERDRKLVRLKKQAASEAGALKCEVCTFDFKEAYGEIGSGFAEVHHRKPVHNMLSGSKTRLDDLAILCANCHRMAHRRAGTLPIEELAEIWSRQRANDAGLSNA